MDPTGTIITAVVGALDYRAYLPAVSRPLPITPMLLSQRRDPFDGDEWLFEPKWDGWRCIAAVRQGRARLLSRNGNDMTARFPAVADALGQLPDGAVLDGELVVLDGDGYFDFAALMRGQGTPSLLAFDVLALAGRDLCGAPIEDRKRRLADLMSGVTGPTIQKTDGIVGEDRALFDVVKARGMEGIVAKRLGSSYAPGRRTGAWIKAKVPGYPADRWSEWFEGGGQRQKEPAGA